MLKDLAKKLIGGPLAFLGGPLGFIAGHAKAARAWLTLLAVASAAAFLYYQFATVKRDRDALLAFSRLACATAGAPFDASSEPPATAKGKPISHKRGELCSLRMLELAKFEHDTLETSNHALAGAIAEHNRKSAADAAAAARNAAAAAAAAQKMKEAENAVGNENRVGGSWFDALNGIAGLRPPAR